jgi:hypothetical protein
MNDSHWVIHGNLKMEIRLTVCRITALKDFVLLHAFDVTHKQCHIRLHLVYLELGVAKSVQ